MDIISDSQAIGIVTDVEIERLAGISHILEPFDPKLLSGCSYDLRIGRPVRSRNRSRVFDLSKRDYCIECGECITFETMEKLDFSPQPLFGLVVNKHSVLARGLVHPITKIDPGFTGRLAITLFNLGNKGEILQYGQALASLIIFAPRTMPTRIYGATQRPSYREGSLDIAAIGNEPDEIVDDEGLSKMYGTAVARLYDRVKELEKRLDVGVLLRKQDRAKSRRDLFWRIIIPLGAVMLGAFINQNWSKIVNFCFTIIDFAKTLLS